MMMDNNDYSHSHFHGYLIPNCWIQIQIDDSNHDLTLRKDRNENPAVVLEVEMVRMMLQTVEDMAYHKVVLVVVVDNFHILLGLDCKPVFVYGTDLHFPSVRMDCYLVSLVG